LRIEGDPEPKLPPPTTVSEKPKSQFFPEDTRASYSSEFGLACVADNPYPERQNKVHNKTRKQLNALILHNNPLNEPKKHIKKLAQLASKLI
jgi:hypothetical protein